MAEISSSRIVITVLGKNRPGIVAGVTRVLGEANVDIRDITQSIIEDIFTMTMLADTAESKLDFAELQKALAEAGELSGVNVSIQREDVFTIQLKLFCKNIRYGSGINLIGTTKSNRPIDDTRQDKRNCCSP